MKKKNKNQKMNIQKENNIFKLPNDLYLGWVDSGYTPYEYTRLPDKSLNGVDISMNLTQHSIVITSNYRLAAMASFITSLYMDGANIPKEETNLIKESGY